jgi:hypothetical protein
MDSSPHERASGQRGGLMTVVDRVAERALALGASGACDEDAVADLQRLAQGNQLALEARRPGT